MNLNKTSIFSFFSYVFFLISLQTPQTTFANTKVAKDQSTNAVTQKFKIIRIAELAQDIKKQKKMYIYDANVESTRVNVGIIPGAQLLESSSDYDIRNTLPTNKNSSLVFYCANEMCTASHTAAERAVGAGYKNVSVMIDGIYGWEKAQQEIEPVFQAAQYISPQKVFPLLQKGRVYLVDVREQEERHEFIADAHSEPLSILRNDANWRKFVQTLPKDKIIVFYCAAGMRSKSVAERLKSEGITSVYFKGPDEWKSFGLPVQKK